MDIEPPAGLVQGCYCRFRRLCIIAQQAFDRSARSVDRKAVDMLRTSWGCSWIFRFEALELAQRDH
jgi:hypothetical protein